VNLSEQLEAAKRQAEVRKLDAGDEKVATELAKRIQPFPVNELSADIRARLDPFNRWAIASRHVAVRPSPLRLLCLHLSRRIWASPRSRYWRS
jgi:hypothetical protein